MEARLFPRDAKTLLRGLDHQVRVQVIIGQSNFSE